MTNREYFEGKMCLYDLLFYISNTVNENYFEGMHVICPVELLNNDKPHHCGETCEDCLTNYLNQEHSSKLPDIADKFVRNKILTPNEIRGIVGLKSINDDEPHHCGKACEECLTNYLNQEH